jgi:hypothetical protein
MNFRLSKPWVFPKRAAKVNTFFNPAKLFAKISKKVQYARRRAGGYCS